MSLDSIEILSATHDGDIKKIEIILANAKSKQERYDLVNSKEDVSEFTPLDYAVSNKYRNIIGLLLLNGADPNFRNKGTISPLMAAIFNEDWFSAKLLSLFGAKLTTEDKKCLTPDDIKKATSPMSPRAVSGFLDIADKKGYGYVVEAFKNEMLPKISVLNTHSQRFLGKKPTQQKDCMVTNIRLAHHRLQ